MKRTLDEAVEQDHSKCKLIKYDGEQIISGATLDATNLLPYKNRKQSADGRLNVALLLQVDGTADDKDTKAHSDMPVQSSLQCDGTNQAPVQGIGTSVPPSTSVTCGTMSSMQAAVSMFNVHSNNVSGMPSCSTDSLRSAAVVYQQSFNGTHIDSALNYLKFMTPQRTVQQQRLPLQPYQIVGGLPVRWNAGRMPKILPPDFDPQFRFKDYPHCDRQGSVVVSVPSSVVPGSQSSVSSTFGSRLHHPVTGYSAAQHYTISPRPTVYGPAVHISTGYSASFARPTLVNRIVDERLIGVPPLEVPLQTNAVENVAGNSVKTNVAFLSRSISDSISVQENGHMKYNAESQYQMPNCQSHTQDLDSTQLKVGAGQLHSLNSSSNTFSRYEFAGNVPLQHRANSSDQLLRSGSAGSVQLNAGMQKHLHEVETSGYPHPQHMLQPNFRSGSVASSSTASDICYDRKFPNFPANVNVPCLRPHSGQNSQFLYDASSLSVSQANCMKTESNMLTKLCESELVTAKHLNYFPSNLNQERTQQQVGGDLVQPVSVCYVYCCWLQFCLVAVILD